MSCYRADVERIAELTRKLDDLRADAADLDRRADALERELRQLRMVGTGNARRAMAGLALGFGPFLVMGIVLVTLGRDVLAGDAPGVLAAPLADTLRAVAPRIDDDQDAAKALDAEDTAGDGHGYLTIVCKPYCDDIIDLAKDRTNYGTSLGPSPVVHQPLAPGEHHLVLPRQGSPPKTVSVVIGPGQVNAQRILMK